VVGEWGGARHERGVLARVSPSRGGVREERYYAIRKLAYGKGRPSIRKISKKRRRRKEKPT